MKGGRKIFSILRTAFLCPILVEMSQSCSQTQMFRFVSVLFSKPCNRFWYKHHVWTWPSTMRITTCYIHISICCGKHSGVWNAIQNPVHRIQTLL